MGSDDRGLDSLTPRRIVSHLDRYIVGQDDAKRAAAVAIRNRWRRRRVPEDLREEVLPKNVIFIGPTGVGKTEIARRIASLIRAPFVKIEATKFTEVGYVGRDVESMVRDLVDAAHDLVRREALEDVRERAAMRAEERLLDVLLPPPSDGDADVDVDRETRRAASREKIRRKLRAGDLDSREVEIRTRVGSASGGFNLFSNQGVEQMGFDLQQLLDRLGPTQTEERRVPVSEARRLLTDEEAENLLDTEAIRRDAIERAQNDGIIFVDELDKVAIGGDGRRGDGSGVSREGVQRDLLPVVEGSAVHTRHGLCRTDHVLFLAAGAFHKARPSDLIPELQGRFPVRVELSDLGPDDLRRILVEPENALTRQYAALLEADGVDLRFEDGGLDALTEIAVQVNDTTENIGARRLHTILEKLLEEPLYEAPEDASSPVVVDRDYVEDALADLAGDERQSRYIL